MPSEVYVLKIASADHVPKDHHTFGTAMVWGGGYVVRAGGGEVDLTRDVAKAGQFETQQEALAFSTLPEMSSLPLVVVRLAENDTPKEGR